jgi:proteasome lid subunit RPN8/RPN11
VIDDIAAHARAALPAECCGILLGSTTEIVEAVPSANLADDPIRRFLLDPKTHIDTLRLARSRGSSVVGFYHSHPHSEPAPSTTDRECASYPDQLYLIIRPLPTGCEARLFRLERSELVEEELLISW